MRHTETTMFDLITGKATHIPHTPTVPLLASMAAQVSIVGLVIMVPLLYVTDSLPAPQSMMAFVAAPPPPPPPPPPAPAPPRTAAREEPVATTSAAAPIDEPAAIRPEPMMASVEGVPGGVEGGVPGGVVAGVVNGLDAAPPPPPPPPPPPRITRVGGDIKAPALLKRVEPVYPPLAVAANIEATVILDAVVDEEGEVTDVRVLRSGGVLDKAAVDALLQWRYAPLMLNGRAAPFQLTVVLSFRLQR
jgi:protein TonB